MSEGLSVEERMRIQDTIARVGYLLDTREYDRLGEVFTADIEFENPGRLVAHGLADLIEKFKAVSTPAVSHHATNVVITVLGAGSVQSQTKALTLRAQGVVTAAIYTDTLRMDPDGWRISSRRIRPLG